MHIADQLPTPDKLTFPEPVTKMVDRLLRERPTPELTNEAAAFILQLASKLADDRVLVDLNTNVGIRRGVRVKLTPNEAVVVHKLSRDYPRIVTLDGISAALWGPRVATGAKTTIRAMLPTLRAKLRPLNATIENKHGVGYRLELHGELF